MERMWHSLTRGSVSRATAASRESQKPTAILLASVLSASAAITSNPLVTGLISNHNKFFPSQEHHAEHGPVWTDT